MSFRPIRVSDSDDYDLNEFGDGEAVELPQIDRGVATSSYGTGSIETDFDDGSYQEVELLGDVTDWTTANRPPTTGTAETREAIVRVDPDGGTGGTRSLAFSASWTWMGSAPATLATGKIALLYLLAVGSDETDVIARWEVEV